MDASNIFILYIIFQLYSQPKFVMEALKPFLLQEGMAVGQND
jgi:hypothetical protein